MQLPTICSYTKKCELSAVNTLCLICSNNMTACSGKAAKPKPDEPKKAQEKKTGTGGLVVFLIVALLDGENTFYYFKVMKPKQYVKGNTNLDNFDFDDYDEEGSEEDDADGKQKDNEK